MQEGKENRFERRRHVPSLGLPAGQDPVRWPRGEDIIPFSLHHLPGYISSLRVMPSSRTGKWVRSEKRWHPSLSLPSVSLLGINCWREKWEAWREGWITGPKWTTTREWMAFLFYLPSLSFFPLTSSFHPPFKIGWENEGEIREGAYLFYLSCHLF